MSSVYYDRQGRPISSEEFVKLYNAPEDPRRVAETTLEDGTYISTVWLGVNMAHDEYSLLIFETAVFPRYGEWMELDADRYGTEEEAIAGHAAMVAKHSPNAAQPTTENGTSTKVASAESQLQDDQSGARQGQKEAEQDGGK